MKVLVACEFSGIVREAFARKGHDAWSCDILPTEVPGNHLQCDVKEILNDGWDLMIAHPPCTHLAASGSRWFKEKRQQQKEALKFFLLLLNAPIPMVCVENPVGIASTLICPATQIVQPWMFGEEKQKATCLWLRNLPKLRPTAIVGKGKMQLLKSGVSIPEWYSNAPRRDRARIRSKTFTGMASAMAEQWKEPYKIGFDFHIEYRIQERR